MIHEPIPLLQPALPTLREIAPLLAVIDANKRYTNFGPLLDIFEERLAAELLPTSGRQHLTTTSNGTSAIEVCLHAYDLPPGANVLVPSFTFVASARAIQNAGLTPVFADINPANLMLTPEIARWAAARFKISAVVPVASFGRYLDLRAWRDFSDETGIPVVVDGAASFGNIPEPFACPITVSFHATKTLPVGEGGAIIYENAEFIAKCKEISNFGLNSGISTTSRGMNAKMTEYQAAIGIKGLENWHSTKQIRLQLLAEYRKRLSSLPNVSLAVDKNTIVSGLPVLANVEIEQLAAYFALNNIETRRWYYPPLHQHPSYLATPRVNDLTHTGDISRTLLGLPFHTHLTVPQVERICETLWKYLDTHEESHHLRSGTNS